MKDEHPSGVMKAAANAAATVSGWSASKQEFARRAVGHGSFSGAGYITPNRLYGTRINEDGDAV